MTTPRLRKLFSDWAEDVVLLTGAGLVSYGAHLVYHPLGFITAGVLLMAGTIFKARGAG